MRDIWGLGVEGGGVDGGDLDGFWGWWWWWCRDVFRFCGWLLVVVVTSMPNMMEKLLFLHIAIYMLHDQPLRQHHSPPTKSISN